MADRQADLPDPYILGDSWGLGWIRFGWDGHRLIGHDGNTIGQAAFLRLLPEQGLAVTLLTNGGQTRDLYEDLFREIFEEVAGVHMPAPLGPPAEPVDVDPSPYLGTYERASVRLEVLAADAEHRRLDCGRRSRDRWRSSRPSRPRSTRWWQWARASSSSGRRKRRPGSRSPSTRCPRASATSTSGPGPRAAWTDGAVTTGRSVPQLVLAVRTRLGHPSGIITDLADGGPLTHTTRFRPSVRV